MLRDKQVLVDISTAIQQIFKYAQDVNQLQLMQDDEKQAAILYRLIVVGEATKRLSTEFREHYPMIPWRQMAGLRDVVIHDYDELDFNILWNVIHINLPDIMPDIQEILNSQNELDNTSKNKP